MTDTAEKTGLAEVLMLAAIPAATVHAVCVSFGILGAFPLKLYIAAALGFCLVSDIRSHAGPFLSKLRGWVSSLAAAELFALGAGLFALFGASVVNLNPGSKSLNEAGGFILAVAGIGSCVRRVGNPRRFIVRVLAIAAALSVIQCAVSAVYCRHEILSAMTGPVSTVEYIRASWKASFYYTNPNSFGFYMMAGGTAAWALTLYFLFHASRLRFLLSLLATGVCAFGILLSASRASMLGFSAAVIFSLCLPVTAKKVFSALRRRPVWSAVLLAAVIAGGAGIFHSYADIFSRKFDNGTLYRSAFWSQLLEDPSRHGAIDVVTANRFSFWKGFLGQQMSSFPSADFFFGRGGVRPINPVDPGMELHNVYLETWGKYGLFCSAGLIVFLVLGVRGTVVRIEFSFLAGASIAFMLHGCFEDKIFINSLQPQLLYLYMALLLPLCARMPGDGPARRKQVLS